MLRALPPVLLAALVCAGCAGAAAPPVPPQSAAPSSMPDPSIAPTANPSAVPTAATSPELVAVVDVRCGPGAPTLGSDRVSASPDGLRMHVTGQPGWELGIEHALGLESVGLDAPSQDLVLRIAPGDVTVMCAEPGSSDLPPGTALRIEDPDGWYRSTDIGEGAGDCVSGIVDYAEGARGNAVHPIQQARELLRGLRAGDIVERAGYATDLGSVRVVRDGEVIGVLTFVDDGHGAWLYSGSTLCGKLGAA